MQTLNVTELDFDAIKQNLISFFSTTDSPFKDWNYSGSGLNQLLDVLAYNTHYNAMLAHMALNETFIDSAQLRSSVVSNAKLVGYIPRSKSATTARISLTLTYAAAVPIQTSGIILPRGTRFKSVVNETAYYFVNLDEISMPNISGSNQYAKTIDIHQGSIDTKRYQVNSVTDRLVYQIDDENIDMSTLIVRTYDSLTALTSNVYTKYTEANIGEVDANSLIYFADENIFGKYQISFGNNVFGKRPSNLSIIEIEYLTTSGSVANGATTFLLIDNVAVSNTNYSQNTITTINNGGSGSDKEDIESIRFNAPASYVSQNRAVTADDYKTLILTNFPAAQSVAVWGGEDNDPPQYGKTFLCVKPTETLTLTDIQKDAIRAILKPKKVLSVAIEFSDPTYIPLTLDVFFKYNAGKTNFSKGEIENAIRDTVMAFDLSNLQKFDGVFRHSALLRSIDNYSAAILNSLVRVYVSNPAGSFIIDPQNQQRTVLTFNMPLSNDDYGHTIVRCDPFNIKGVQSFLGDEAISGDSTYRRLYTYYLDAETTDRIKINTDVGEINVLTGKFEIDAIFADDNYDIILDIMPASNDIAPKRNQLIRIDSTRLSVFGEVDTIAIGGSSRNAEYTTFKRDR